MIAYPILYVEEPQNQQKRDPVVRVCVLWEVSHDLF